MPCDSMRALAVYGYMFGKFTSRWGFYRVLGRVCRVEKKVVGGYGGVRCGGIGGYKGIREVVNPKKEEKLRIVALRHGFEPEVFVRVGWWLRWVWPLLP